MKRTKVKRSSSFLELMAQPTVKGSQLILYFSTCVSHVLRSSRGRDKILGVVQHLSDLYKNCMIDYLAENRIREWPIILRNAKIINESMKNGRKIFRLLRWIEELGSIGKNTKGPYDAIIILKLVRHIAGAIYYILDNLVWVAQIGVISKVITNANWKWESTKDAASFVRYILLLIINLFSVRKRRAKETELIEELESDPGRIINYDNHGYKKMLSLVKIRTKRRYQALDIMKNFLRIFMLMKSLKLPFTQNVSGVFYSICGITSSALAIFKLLTLKTQIRIEGKQTIKRTDFQ
ncbi:unnamed protein product [Blepharisma stoltei]|uniref:Peroxisomal membrane protein 11B n=1 Tax=Blepharisma stoltei TaxID=1481888 RepID=A0AAU9JWS0_9CILI|nr:unnamed protein product [Blepharisma stoltei]